MGESIIATLYDSLKVFKDSYRINEVSLKEYKKHLNKEDLKDIEWALEMKKVYNN
jgi:hypothetical protein